MEKSVTKVAVYPHGETGMVAKIAEYEMIMDKVEKVLPRRDFA